MIEILIPPLFRMLGKAFQALEHELDNHVERIEVLEAEKREGKAYIEKLRGELENLKTGAQLRAEERAVLEAALNLDRARCQGNRDLIPLLESLHLATATFRATGRSL
jgi:chromosome segregation ATPase